MSSELEYYSASSTHLPAPATNKDVYTWLPLMNFQGEDLGPKDLEFFNAVLIPGRRWQTSRREIMVSNLLMVFAACLDLYNDYKTGALNTQDALPFFGIAEEYLRDTVESFPEDPEGPRRLAKLIKFFVKAFSVQVVGDGSLTHPNLLVDSAIMSLLHKIDQFHAVCTGKEEVFPDHAGILRFHEDLYCILA
ncbi:hypothetical protein F5Y13DRAFT_198768 [Hypoxylon sp. FL1857]|nr:hypothetical protein F5Y13DRAFT_198768 [Hypoxylon sp. FL1857]